MIYSLLYGSLASGTEMCLVVFIYESFCDGANTCNYLASCMQYYSYGAEYFLLAATYVVVFCVLVHSQKL